MEEENTRETQVGVAIIGMAGRFPGAADLESFWSNLCQGVESITRFSPQELRAAGVDESLVQHPSYVPARSILEGADRFDAAFFGFNPREAEILDPQQRVFLEVCWQALEDAGYDPSGSSVPAGVFAGSGINSYLLTHLLSRRDVLDSVGDYQAMLLSDPHFLATRTSYKLNLKGPSLTVQTACSTSLVAVHLAVQSLLNGECDLALAGGVRIAVPQVSGYLYEEGGVLSPDGRCRAFDARAAGCVDGNGAAAVVLKRLGDALDEGDSIRAVILATAVNNDGSGKVGYTAPSVQGQSEAISMALALAEAQPETVGYVEAHGTGTPLGDPIEVQALQQAFHTSKRGFCALGSVKPNIGHLDAAAGIAGLVKAVLALQHRRLPPTLHFERPNPAIDFEQSPFFVNDRLRDWTAQGARRRAGVSSFGIGGTNAHAVLEQAPPQAPSGESRPWQLMVLSARSATALEEAHRNLVQHLEAHPQVNLADAAFTLQTGRHAFEQRRMLVCRDLADAVDMLKKLDPLRVQSARSDDAPPPIAFAFPGQGSQYAGMLAGLYEEEPTFRQQVDKLLDSRTGAEDTDSLRPDAWGLSATAHAQPALFIAEYALARLLMSWGIRPAGMIGHSVGEFAAACLGGTLSPEDALRLVSERGRLMQQMPAGAMTAVHLPENELEALLPEGASLAAVNGPRLCVASGPTAAIERLEAELESRGAGWRRLVTSHAFHSAMMDPVLEPFARAVEQVELREPEIPWVSNRTGRLITPQQAVDPNYWVEQLRRPVRFSEGLAELLRDPQAVLLEVGPGDQLTSLARRHPSAGGGRLAVSAGRPPKKRQDDQAVLLQALGRLWLRGVEVDWEAFHGGERRRRVPLPTYPFQRRRYWLDPRPGALWMGAQPIEGKRSDLSRWFYVPAWRQTPPLPEQPAGRRVAGRWLTFEDAEGPAALLSAALAEAGAQLVRVRIGTGFQASPEEGIFQIDLGQTEHYRRLISQLHQDGEPLEGIVHAWGLSAGSLPLEQAEERCFFSLVRLAQALAQQDPSQAPRLAVVANGVCQATGVEDLHPEKALLLGPCRVIPQEHPGWSCRVVDVALPGSDSPRASEWAACWAEEVLSEREEPLVACRGLDRWVQDFQPMPLPAPSDDLPLPRLRPQSVCLITGGFGGLGLEFARELARSGARLVLAGRSLPQDDRRRRRLRELEELGAEVLPLAADVSDPRQVRQMLDQIDQRFGRLDGVIHAAGRAGGTALDLLDRQTASAVLAPKARGALALCEALGDRPLDFLIFCSSLTSVLAGPGQADYTAANAFLDALARQRCARLGRSTVSVGWDAWQQVGMAARAAGAGEEEAADEGSAQPAGHPLLDRYVAEDGVRRTYLTRLDPSRHWVLSEHRLGGQPVVPGTAYLEMARAAYEGLAGATSLEMRDILFLGPLQVRDNETRQVRTVLERAGEGFRFAVASRSGGNGGQSQAVWQEHAVGSIVPLAGQPSRPRRYDLEKLLEECGRRREQMGEEYRESLRSAGLGPRWEVLESAYVGQGRVVGEIRLDEGYAADLQDLKLHPSLLDVATGFAEEYMQLEQGYYLPLSYRRLRLHSPLPAKLYSYARFPENGGKETVSFDLELLDGQGQVVAEIEGFTVKRVPDVAGTARSLSQPAATEEKSDLAAGILPQEGAQVLRRLLAGRMPPHLLVSTRGLETEFEEMRRLVQGLREREAGDAEAHERPELETDYLAPRNPVEERIASIWQAVLGIDRVGVEDDFFELGGHSLLATQVVSRIRDAFQVEVPIESLFEATTVSQFARLVESGAAQAPPEEPLPAAPRDEPLPLSFAQQRLWFLEQLSPGSPVYHISHAVRLQGDLQAEALEAAIAEVERRHEVLRSGFPERPESPCQEVRPARRRHLPLLDLSGLPAAARQFQADRLAKQAAVWRFDLAEGPLTAFLLLRLGQGEHIFLFTLHNLVADGWSAAILVQELAEIYRTLLAGRPAGLPRLSVQYADYAAWQRQRFEEASLQEELDYWRERLSGELPVLHLPADRPRPALQTFRGGSRFFSLPAETTSRLKSLASVEKASLFMTLTAGFLALLQRHSGQDDLIVGTPIAARDRPELEGLIGNFLNTLALRVGLSGGPSFRGLLGRVREAALGAYARQSVPFEKIVEELQPQRDMSRSPVFQALFSMQEFPAGSVELPGLVMEILPVRETPAQTDVTVFASESDGRVRLELQYNRSIFDETTMARMEGQLARLFEYAAQSPDRSLADCHLLPAAQRHQLLLEWNDTARPYPEQAGIAKLLKGQAGERPDAVAAVFGGSHLSYAALIRRARGIAQGLRGRGVATETLAGIFVPRSLELLEGLTGIVVAGAAYLPLDPAYPPERLERMLEDSGTGTVLTLQEISERLPQGKAALLHLDAGFGSDPAAFDGATASPDNLAYVMYTSGSTGLPKGAAVTQRGVVRLVRGTSYARLGPRQVFLQTAVTSFDASTFQIWGCLLNGGRLVFFPPQRPTLELLGRMIARHGVTMLGLPAALFRLMVEHNLEGLLPARQVLAGGDVLSASHAKRALEAGLGRLINAYGPTENTTYTCCHVMESPAKRAPLPIGKAIANTTVYVLDARGRLAPEGAAGELYTGGAGLARGYWQRPALTAQRFVPHPFGDGERLYRTGDLVRIRRGGVVEFLGRIDHQVKIRGFRVEPGEVESVLSRHEGVREAVVMARGEAGQRRLVAFVVSHRDTEDTEPLTPESLSRFLEKQLPDFMVPSAFVLLDELPLTPNGKLDRARLPEEGPVQTDGYRAPETPAQELVAGIWAEVLGVEKVGARDSFFQLGGHSLLATQAVSRLRQAFGVELPLRAVFEAPTPEALARRLDEERVLGEASAAVAMVAGERPTELPLSFAQRRLWFLDQLEPDSAFYNVPLALRLEGRLDISALQSALSEIVRRHESLRTVFPARDGKPRQVIHPPADVPLPLIDLSGLPAVRCEAEQGRLTAQEALTPFDLSRGPLLRTALILTERDAEARGRGGFGHGHGHGHGHEKEPSSCLLPPASCLLLLTMHHIVSDGWSLGVLVRELTALYRSFAAGRPSPLPELPLQYADFALWQRRRLAGEAMQKQLDYWKGRLEGAPVLELPSDRPRPAQPTFRGASMDFGWPRELLEELQKLSRRQGVTLFMTLMAAFQALLRRWCGQDDLSVGTPIANRNRSEVEGLIGFFVNALVLRTRLAGDPPFSRLLQAVREAALEAYARQDVPFEQLVEFLQPERSLSRSPLFQVMLVLQNAPVEEQQLEGLRMSPLPVETGTAKFDLTLILIEDDGPGLRGAAEYSLDLFEASTIERLLRHFRTLLGGVVQAPEERISDLPLMSRAEIRQVLEEFNATRRDYPRQASIPRLFGECAAARPDAVATAFEDEQLSYGELDRRSSRLARLLTRRGVGRESLVGLPSLRSLELPLELIAILKAGGAYLPLDPDYPRERLLFMMEDTGAQLMLVREEQLGAIPAAGWEVLCLDRHWEEISSGDAGGEIQAIDPLNRAYVVYTSGSTGLPKGVEVCHRSVVRLVRGSRFAEMGDEEVFLQLAPVSFDASTLELWGALLNGGRLAVFPPQVPTLDLLGQEFRRCQVTALWLTAPLFHLMVEQNLDDLAAVRQVLAGGDALSPQHVRRALAGGVRRLINGYGPTENTTFTCCHPMQGQAGDWHSVPIGAPIANTSVFVLDRSLVPVPLGVPGELLIGGDGLARGYLNRPRLSAERFIPHPFGQGERVYRTGDRVRWRPDGTLGFLGRLDHQVKIRGFRVEPGEVENVLARHPAVTHCAVVARETSPGQKTLVAFASSDWQPRPGAAELKGFLEEELPDYMVPSLIVLLEEMPMTPSGKVDRKALPREAAAESSQLYVPPSSPMEEVLVGIWSDLLGVEAGRVSVEDSFFDLGGHSLLATQAISRVRRAFGVDLALRELFEMPTPALLARRLERAWMAEQSGGIPPLEKLPRDGNLPLSYAQQRLWFLDQLDPGSAVYNVPAAFRMQGALDVAALHGGLNEILRRHESLRTVFPEQNGKPRQLISPRSALRFPLIDLCFLPEAIREDELKRLAGEEALAPFNLSQGPLIRAALVLLEGGRRETGDGRREEGESPRRTRRARRGRRLGLTTDNWQLTTDSGVRHQASGVREENPDSDSIPSPGSRLPSPSSCLLPPASCLLLTMHHIVSDGWSQGVLVRELAELYECCRRRQPSALPELPVQYADFAGWQRSWLKGDVLEQQAAYWKQKLAGAPPLELVGDHPRPARQSYRGAMEPYSWPRELVEGLEGLARAEDATLYMALLALFQLLLSRCSGQDDISLGTPIANRSRSETEGLIGFFVNTLVLRSDLSGEPAFRRLLGRVRETALEAFAHQDIPFEQVVEALQPQRTLSRTPLFQVMLVLQNAPSEKPSMGGLEVSRVIAETWTAKFDLTLSGVESEEGLFGAMEYSRDLFEAPTVRRMLGHLRTLAEAAVEAPERSIVELPLMSQAERRQVVEKFSSAPAEYPRQSSIPQLFEEQCAQRPDAAATAFLDQQLSYAELERRSGQLARHLASLGAVPESLVGIFTQRSTEMVIGLLGILRCGAGYLPLDPSYPAERLSFMLSDAGAGLLLTPQETLERLPGGTARPVVVDRDWGEIATGGEAGPLPPVRPDQLAYVIYTSGSTGMPKGVEVNHRSVLRLVRGANYAQLDESQVFLQLAPVSFDASTLELWGALLNGARLAVFPPQQPSLELLQEEICRHGVSVLWLTAPLFHLMADQSPETLSRVPQLLAGGDVLSVSHVRRVLAAGTAAVINGYGPTENTTFTACHRMTDPDSPGFCPTDCDEAVPWHSIPIGRPVSNSTVYVLDRRFEPVPVGVPGELCTGGDGVARGYRKRPALTAQRFIPDPFARGERLYRTGDLVRWRPDGALEFLGRLDHQVKVRGFRVEPGEIESLLAIHPAVSECAVAARPDPAGNRRLVAYAASDWDPLPSSAELEGFLAEQLPDYMLPSLFVVLKELPHTPSGKIDRRSLPDEQLRPQVEYVAPRTPWEEKLSAIWSEILGVEKVGIKESFFDLGGHSLLATQAISRIQQEFGLQLPVRAVFEAPTVEAMAKRVEGGEALAGFPGLSEPGSPLVALQAEGERPPFFCVHPAGGGVFSYLELARRLSPDQPFYGLQAPELESGDEPRNRVEELAQSYLEAVRRVQPEGPYHLGGHSFGGVVAFEMSRRLLSVGQEVAVLALLDSSPLLTERAAQAESASLLATFALYLGLPLDRLPWDRLSDLDSEGQLEVILEQARRADLLLPGLSPDQLRRLFHLLRAHVQAHWNYKPEPCPVRAVLFWAQEPLEAAPVQGRPALVSSRAAEVFAKSFDKIRQAWGALVETLEVHEMPGNHFSMLQEPQVRVLAEKLRQSLDSEPS